MNPAELTESLLARLRGIAVLQHVSADHAAVLAARMTPRRIGLGGTLASEGESGGEMFVLVEGALRLTRRAPNQEDFTVAVLDGRDTPCAGEFALLRDERRADTILAASASVVLVLKREDFERFGDEYPEAGLRITRNISRRAAEQLGRAHEDCALLFEALMNEVRSKSEE
jgi:CRP-like cAMP-binding protein